MTATTPIFCVVLKDGHHWQVEAEWPDGTVELVSTFRAGLDALNWVEGQSATWMAERVANATGKATPLQIRIDEACWHGGHAPPKP